MCWNSSFKLLVERQSEEEIHKNAAYCFIVGVGIEMNVFVFVVSLVVNSNF